MTQTQVISATNPKDKQVTNEHSTQLQNLTPTRNSYVSGRVANTRPADKPAPIRSLGVNGRVVHKETVLDKNSIFSTENVYPVNSATPKQIKNEVSSKLACSVSKVDIFDDSKPVLGYPNRH